MNEKINRESIKISITLGVYLMYKDIGNLFNLNSSMILSPNVGYSIVICNQIKKLPSIIKN